VVYQLLANGRWLSPGTPAKTGFHDIAEILLKVALNDLQQDCCFLIVLLGSSTKKTDCQCITGRLTK
jgi:hypothetical protein